MSDTVQLVVLVLLACVPSSNSANENEDVQQTSFQYSPACPQQASPWCSPFNKCTKCHSSCRFCQNLTNSTCGASDCMVCHESHYLLIEFSDHTGRCVPEGEIFLPTCPSSNPRCQPGNRCFLCPAPCKHCYAQSSVCSLHDCTACQDGYALSLEKPGQNTGSCVRMKLSYKKTCPKGSHHNCSPLNQCETCPKGCTQCQNTTVTVCDTTDCFGCEPGYVLQVRESGEAVTYNGACVYVGRSSETTTRLPFAFVFDFANVVVTAVFVTALYFMHVVIVATSYVAYLFFTSSPLI